MDPNQNQNQPPGQQDAPTAQPGDQTMGQPGGVQPAGDISAPVPAEPVQPVDPAAEQPIYQDPNAMTNLGQPTDVKSEPVVTEQTGNEPTGGEVPPVPNTAI